MTATMTINGLTRYSIFDDDDNGDGADNDELLFSLHKK